MIVYSYVHLTYCYSVIYYFQTDSNHSMVLLGYVEDKNTIHKGILVYTLHIDRTPGCILL